MRQIGPSPLSNCVHSVVQAQNISAPTAKEGQGARSQQDFVPMFYAAAFADALPELQTDPNSPLLTEDLTKVASAVPSEGAVPILEDTFADVAGCDDELANAMQTDGLMPINLFSWAWGPR